MIQTLRRFVHQHDDIPAFHAAFLVWTFLAAMLLNSGFFALLIAIHFTLDVIKYRDFHRMSYGQTIEASVQESLPDIVLLMLGITFVVYFRHSFAIDAVSGIIRAEMTITAGLAVLIPKIAILRHDVAVAVHPRLHMQVCEAYPFSWYQACACLLVIACFGLLVTAPLVLHLPTEVFAQTLGKELAPWKL